LCVTLSLNTKHCRGGALGTNGCPRDAACLCWERGARRGPCARCVHPPRLHRLGPSGPPQKKGTAHAGRDPPDAARALAVPTRRGCTASDPAVPCKKKKKWDGACAGVRHCSKSACIYFALLMFWSVLFGHVVGWCRGSFTVKACCLVFLKRDLLWSLETLPDFVLGVERCITLVGLSIKLGLKLFVKHLQQFSIFLYPCFFKKRKQTTLQ